MSGEGEGAVGFVRARIGEVLDRPALGLWYAVLAIVGVVECHWVPDAVAGLGASEAMRHAYLALGFAAVLAEICCLDLFLRHAFSMNPRALLVLPLFLVSLLVTKQADLITYGRERNERAVQEQSLRDRFTVSEGDHALVREQVQALNASTPGGLLTVASYQDQIDALERRRDDGQWKPQAEVRDLTAQISALLELRGKAERRDELSQSATAAPRLALADPVRDPSRDWDAYLAVAQPIARAVTGRPVEVTPDAGAQFFGASLMVFSAAFLTLGAAAVGGRPRERPSVEKGRGETRMAPPLPTPQSVATIPPRGSPDRARRRRLPVAPDDERAFGWGPVRNKQR